MALQGILALALLALASFSGIAVMLEAMRKLEREAEHFFEKLVIISVTTYLVTGTSLVAVWILVQIKETF